MKGSEMKNVITMAKTLFRSALGMCLLLTLTPSAKALTEAEIRNVLIQLAAGTSLTANPQLSIVEFVASKTPVTVDTFAGLATLSLAGRDDGSVVYVKGTVAGSSDGGGMFRLDLSSSATTNTWGISATSGSGRWITMQPLHYHATTNWAVPILTTNANAYGTVSVSSFTSGYPSPGAGDHATVGIQFGSTLQTNLAFTAMPQTNGTILVTVYNVSSIANSTAFTNNTVVRYTKWIGY